MTALTALTAKKLSATVGAEVIGADRDRRLNDDASSARDMHRTTLYGDEPIQ